jgi:hypothetical protein
MSTWHPNPFSSDIGRLRLQGYVEDQFGVVMLTAQPFVDLCQDLQMLERSGDVEILEASVPFDRVLSNGVFSADIMSWTLRVYKTGKTFKLFADTYHGRCTLRECR